MKIYLVNRKNYKWELHEGTLEELKPELELRHIKISPTASIGNWASIGDRASIGNKTYIGVGASIKKFEKFTDIDILIHIGVVMQGGRGVFYKAIKEDLTDFYSGKYQYKIGKGDCNKQLKRAQNINCGDGWHFTNLWQAIKFGKEQNIPFKIISAEIELADILSVYEKVRVKAFKNVQEVKIEGLI